MPEAATIGPCRFIRTARHAGSSAPHAMPGQAQQIGRACADIGLLEFIAFCASRKRRLIMLVPDGPVDIASAFAAPLIDSTWCMEPFQRLVVPVVGRGKAGW